MATYIARTIYVAYSSDAKTYKFDSRYSVAKFYQAGGLGVPLTSIICIAGEIRNTNSMLAR